MENQKIVLFQEKTVRRVWHNDEWHFSVIDVIEILTDSPKPRVYWGVLKTREPQLFTICKQLKMVATDGRNRSTDCANTRYSIVPTQYYQKSIFFSNKII